MERNLLHCDIEQLKLMDFVTFVLSIAVCYTYKSVMLVA